MRGSPKSEDARVNKQEKERSDQLHASQAKRASRGIASHLASHLASVWLGHRDKGEVAMRLIKGKTFIIRYTVNSKGEEKKKEVRKSASRVFFFITVLLELQYVLGY
jgi:hypothetical protein